jgi:hypothetical protein
MLPYQLFFLSKQHKLSGYLVNSQDQGNIHERWQRAYMFRCGRREGFLMKCWHLIFFENHREHSKGRQKRWDADQKINVARLSFLNNA